MKRTYFLASLLGAFLMFPHIVDAQTYGVTTEEKNEQNTPDGWTKVSLPSLTVTNPSGTRLQNIVDYGASTESTDNHKAIQDAIDALHSRGGVVVIPKGTWLTGAFTLKAKTILHLENGATLKMLPMGEWKDGESPLISFKSGATDIIVEGENEDSCFIDGQGADWWAVRDKYGKESSQWANLKRPGIMDIRSGSRFLIKNFTIKNSPTVNIHVGNKNTGGMHTTFHNVRILAPASELRYSSSNAEGKNPSHNTDGISVWTRFVNIYDCEISTGDDNVVMDEGAQYVHVWNCSFGTGHGASIGSYTTNVHDILWDSIDFEGTSLGFRLKSNVGRSGSVYNITVKDCNMNNVGGAISMTAWYDDEPSNPATVTKTDSVADTPYYHDILIQNLKATNVKGESVHMYGRPESYISNVTLDNVQIKASQGMYLAYVRGLKFINGCNLATNSGNFIKKQYKASFSGRYDGMDVPTGISSPTINTPSITTDNAWYNLSGQKVDSSNMSKGIFIHQGKKYVVK